MFFENVFVKIKINSNNNDIETIKVQEQRDEHLTCEKNNSINKILTLYN